MLHGFVANGEVEAVMGEIGRVLKPEGILGVVDFKKTAGTPGPPMSGRITPEEVISVISLLYGFRVKASYIDVGIYSYAITFTAK